MTWQQQKVEHMSLDVNESISSLVDGELDAVDRKRVIDQIKNSHEHQQAFGRYCMISEALKRNLPSSPSHNLFSRVQAALESEPVLFSPSPASIGDDIKKAEVVPLRPNSNSPQSSGSKHVVGFAVAASIALMTVVGFQFMSSPEGINPGLPLAQTQIITPSQDSQLAQRPAEGVTTVSSAVEEPLYAEQSVINDGQWTRITHLGNLSRNGTLGHQSAESHANVFIPGSAIPFTRAVNLENTPPQ